MGRILVVEDDPAMTDGIRDVLELAGHDVTTAADGLDALARIRASAPDLIVSDVMMPRMSGYELFAEVRRNPAWTFLPFVFLTALSQPEDAARGMRMGADDYLVKPVDPRILVATVDARLARSAALAQAAAADLRRVSRLVTGVIGHELRTPISWISAYSEILLELRHDMGGPDLEMALDGIRSGSLRLATLAEDAVLLVSIDSGQADTDFRVGAMLEPDLAAHLAHLVDDHRVDARRRGVEIRLTAEAGLPAVMIADRHLGVLVRHLIDNAVKFSRPAPLAEVRLELRSAPHGVELVVENDGVGVPAADLERMFEPLTQVARERHEQQGIGLGLALARGITALHGGRVWAESGEDGPTAVHVFLPAAEPEAWVAPPPGGTASVEEEPLEAAVGSVVAQPIEAAARA